MTTLLTIAAIAIANLAIPTATGHYEIAPSVVRASHAPKPGGDQQIVEPSMMKRVTLEDQVRKDTTVGTPDRSVRE